MPPIRKGDGTRVAPKGISQVRTGDGRIFFDGPAIPDAVVEDWERDEPIDDYTHIGTGSIDKFSISTDAPEGDKALEVDVETSNSAIRKTNGLEGTPTKGDRFSSVLRMIAGDSSFSSGVGFSYGTVIDGEDNLSGYFVFIFTDQNTDESFLRVRRYDDDTFDEDGVDIIDVEIPDANLDTWYEVEIEWHDGGGSEPDNEHVATVYEYDTEAEESEARGDALASGQTNDDTYTSGDQIIVGTETPAKNDGATHDRYWIIGQVD